MDFAVLRELLVEVLADAVGGCVTAGTEEASEAWGSGATAGGHGGWWGMRLVMVGFGGEVGLGGEVRLVLVGCGTMNNNVSEQQTNYLFVTQPCLENLDFSQEIAFFFLSRSGGLWGPGE